MKKFDIQALLYALLQKGRFINHISISSEEMEYLRECRGKVRGAIRAEFTAIRNAVRNDQQHLLLESIDADAKAQVAGLVPKFWSQGSYVYKTLNDPAHNPPQQVDLDDGVYLPMKIMSDQPVLKKQIFFKIVDSALQKLCKAEGWRFDNSKNTCCRVIVNQRIHIDVPLYAIPDERYQAITLAVAENRAMYKADFAEGLYQKTVYLDENEVYLALRDSEHWVISDPMKIQKWFQDVLRAPGCGERLRRVCRYLKAWRDHEWPNGGGPSSIALMICAVKTFGENKVFEKDCDALLAVAKALPGQLQQGVFIDEEEFYPRKVRPEDQATDIQSAKGLASTLIRALELSPNAQEVVQQLRLAFGERMPNRPDWVTPLSIAPAVRTVPRKTQPRPDDMSHNMRSGQTNYRCG